MYLLGDIATFVRILFFMAGKGDITGTGNRPGLG